MLVTPPADTGWRVDIAALDLWLSSRWPGIRRDDDRGRYPAHRWIWSDLYEVRVPDDRTCVWIDADDERTCAVASWCAGTASDPLILCDEGYSDVYTLDQPSEAELLTRMRAR